MFTGLIEATGTVLALREIRGTTRLIIAAPKLAGLWNVGDSIAVSGVCLTAVDLEEIDGRHPGRFAADLAEETIRRTTLIHLRPGALVNLERPTPAGHPLGGHVVQGHVDGTGKIVSLIPLREDLNRTDWRLTIEVPPDLSRSIIPQGSITIDGISLTVARVHGQRIEVAIIPHTYRATNLHSVLAGSIVNLETDILSRYASQQAIAGLKVRNVLSLWTVADAEAPADERLSDTRSHTTEWLTVEYLLANGY